MEPHSIQIINSNSDNTITLDDEALRSIFARDEIKDRYVSVISVTGVFRQGKSFLLNFLLRYLRMKYVEKRDVLNWLTPEEGPLKGFEWSPGSKRHTTGIHMWSEIFLANLPSGDEVAIILIDTQGAFDTQATMSDCATIFALSTLISSVQIYNVMRSIKLYDLMHLQCFGDYGSLFTNGESAPFQNLCFLVRDWACPYEKQYGVDGGLTLLKEVFQSSTPEIKEQADSIKKIFDKMSCFLLPYPGRVVDASNTFGGDLREIDNEFKKHVQEFVTMILAPQHLIVKTVNGEKVKAESLMFYIQEYSKVLKGGTLPKVETVFKATVEAHYRGASAQALKVYKKNMNAECRYSRKCFTPIELYKKHTTNKVKSVDYYNKLKKFTDLEVHDKYLVQLKDCMDVEFKWYKEINDDKLREVEERKKRMEQQIALTTGRTGGGGGLRTLGTAEKVGLAASVVGGVAVLALGVSKFFNNSRGNSD
jgi:atlastin